MRQGKTSIQDSLRFRTLAAASRNKRSLLRTYRQGLKPSLQLHLAAYDDTIMLECIIPLSIRVATRMKTCMEGQKCQNFQHRRTSSKAHADWQHPLVLGRTLTSADPGSLYLLWFPGQILQNTYFTVHTFLGNCQFVVVERLISEAKHGHAWLVLGWLSLRGQ